MVGSTCLVTHQPTWLINIYSRHTPPKLGLDAARDLDVIEWLVLSGTRHAAQLFFSALTTTVVPVLRTPRRSSTVAVAVMPILVVNSAGV